MRGSSLKRLRWGRVSLSRGTKTWARARAHVEWYSVMAERVTGMRTWCRNSFRSITGYSPWSRAGTAIVPFIVYRIIDKMAWRLMPGKRMPQSLSVSSYCSWYMMDKAEKNLKLYRLTIFCGYTMNITDRFEMKQDEFEKKTVFSAHHRILLLSYWSLSSTYVYAPGLDRIFPFQFSG